LDHWKVLWEGVAVKELRSNKALMTDTTGQIMEADQAGATAIYAPYSNDAGHFSLRDRP